MRILVTGGAGFIGSNLCEILLNQPTVDEVRVLDDLSTGFLENLSGLDVDFVEGSILDQDLLKRITDGVDSIVHLGAIPSVPRSIANPRASHEANATGTLNVLEAAQANGVSHVVVASSSSVYGANPALPKDEREWTRPMSPYAVSKLATEAYAVAWGYSYGLHTLALRFFNVYGPKQAAGHAYAAVIPKFLDAALHNDPVTIHGDGTQSRDFTYVGTLCRILTDAAVRGVHSPDPVNAAFGTNTDLLALLSLIERELGHPVDRIYEAPRIGDVKASQANSARLKSLFPDVKPVTLEEGLRETIHWFQEQGLKETSA